MRSFFLQFGAGDPRTFTGLAPTFLFFKDPGGSNITPPGITEVPSSTGLYYFNYGVTTPIGFLADAATTSPGTAGRYVTGSIDPSDRISEYGNTLIAYGLSLLTGQSNLGSSLIGIGNSSIALGTTSVALGISNIALGTTSVAWLSAIGTTQIAEGATIVAIGNSLSALGISMSALGLSFAAIATAIGSTASPFGDSVTDPVTVFGFLKRSQEFNEGNASYNKASGGFSLLARGGNTLIASKLVSDSATMTLKT